jgi:hypothetical protein
MALDTLRKSSSPLIAVPRFQLNCTLIGHASPTPDMAHRFGRFYCVTERVEAAFSFPV